MKRIGLALIALLALVVSAFAEATIISGPAVRQYSGRMFGAAVVLTNGSLASAVMTLPSAATVAGVATVYGTYTVFTFSAVGDPVAPGDSLVVDVTDGFDFDTKSIVCAVGAGGLTSCR